MSIWQTNSWQKMLKESGQVSEFFNINWIFVEKRKIVMWEYGLFVIWIENEITKKDTKNLIELLKKENCLFIQVEDINYNSVFKTNLDWFNRWYYKKFITPYTAIIDLKKTNDEIFADMKPKWRYNIRLAEKKWIWVSIVDKTDKNIQDYYNLMLETTSRDNFSWNTLNYYKTFLNSLENSKLILAKKDWFTIAGWIFIFDTKISIYYYWASTSKKEYRNLMAPYLIQWEAIKYAKSIWSEIYDFLWVASSSEKDSSLSWVTDFKKKLTKNIIEVSSSHIYINKKIKYFIINTLRKLKG